MVATTTRGDYAAQFIDQNIVSVGWSAAGSLKGLNRDQIIARVKETPWPDFKPMKAVVSGSQLDKYTNAMQVNDRVITYDPSTRIYHIGRIKGEYEFDSKADDVLANRRPVAWESVIDRDKLYRPHQKLPWI